MADPVMEAFADGRPPQPLYTDVVHERPPFPTRLVQCGEWWGCSHWLIRGEPAGDYWIDGHKAVGKRIADAEDLLTKSVPAELTPARFSCGAALVYVGAASDARVAVDPIYLIYTEAYARIEEWKFGRGGFADHPEAGYLLGVRADELVAVIAPRLADEPLDLVEREVPDAT